MERLLEDQSMNEAESLSVSSSSAKTEWEDLIDEASMVEEILLRGQIYT